MKSVPCLPSDPPRELTLFIILKRRNIKSGTRGEFHAHSLLEFYLGLAPGVSASAVDGERKPYLLNVGGDDVVPDVSKMCLKRN